MSDKNHRTLVDGTVTIRANNDEIQSAIEAFLANGGNINRLKDDNGIYDKNLKKTTKRLAGGFNPFTKDEALAQTD